MIAREGSYPHPHDGILCVISQIRPPGPCSPTNQSPRLPSAKLQHGIGCKIISRILWMSKYWHIEHIECCMPDFVQSRKEKLSNGGVRRRDSSGGSFGWYGIHNMLQQHITDRHSRPVTLSPGPGIDRSHFWRPD